VEAGPGRSAREAALGAAPLRISRIPQRIAHHVEAGDGEGDGRAWPYRHLGRLAPVPVIALVPFAQRSVAGELDSRRVLSHASAVDRRSVCLARELTRALRAALVASSPS
jgi:hypothetical protein